MKHLIALLKDSKGNAQKLECWLKSEKESTMKSQVLEGKRNLKLQENGSSNNGGF